MALILGIESSCDETAAAVVEDGAKLRSNIVLSQTPVHSLYGGVVPELASREHLRAVVPVVRQALEKAGIELAGVDAIAVTYGPGLVGALLVGITYAKSLAMAAAKPLIAVNHLEGHVHAVLLEARIQDQPEPELPAVALVVSGGHTHLYHVTCTDGRYAYRTLGHTRDDAAGEAYDKVAKLLGLGYPGGPLVDRLAPFGDVAKVRFNPVKLKGNPLDFSFSGLKTAVLHHVKQHGMEPAIAERKRAVAALGRPPQLDDWRQLCDAATLDLIAGFQAAVVSELSRRGWLAADETPGTASFFLTGGVAANRALRAEMQIQADRRGTRLCAPSMSLCTDNAAMIAAAAYPRYRRQLWASNDLAAVAQLPLDASG